MLFVSTIKCRVTAGNSPFTNPEQVIHEDGTPFDFIEWHRSARWVTAIETFTEEPSDQDLFDFYTDRKADHGSLKETRKFLRDAQTFLGCEILALREFLEEKGLLYEYLRYKDSASLTEVQGDSGHAQVKMVADVYSHIIDDDRRINAQRFEEQFYQGKNTSVTEETQVETVSQTDQEMLLKLLANPEMAELLKSLAKNL